MIRLLFSALLAFTLLTGCTAPQQDALLEKFVDYGRQKAGLELKHIQLADSNVAYLERQGSGPSVMLVHGFSANKDTWLALVPELPKDWHIIIPDLTGHGETTASPEANYLLTSQAQRLHELSTLLQLGKTHLVGNSMGGAISMIYAATYPKDTASLVLMDAAGMNAPEPSEYMQALARGENPLIATDEASFNYRWEFVMSKRPPLVWPLKPAMIRKTLERVDINRKIFDDMLATQALLGDDFEQHLAQATMPVMIMWGEEDRVLDKSAIGEFQKHLPQASVVLYEGIGHLPMVEAPKQTAKDLTAFIK